MKKTIEEYAFSLKEIIDKKTNLIPTPNSLNYVVKSLITISEQYPKNSLQWRYYKLIIRGLFIEMLFENEMKANNRPLYHYYMYMPTIKANFEYDYNTYSPIRFAIETMDSINEIRSILKIISNEDIERQIKIIQKLLKLTN